MSAMPAEHQIAIALVEHCTATHYRQTPQEYYTALHYVMLHITDMCGIHTRMYTYIHKHAHAP